MDKKVYVCTGTCQAEISEEDYKKGLVKCGTHGCTHFGHTFAERLKCRLCDKLYKVEEEHHH